MCAYSYVHIVFLCAEPFNSDCWKKFWTSRNSLAMQCVHFESKRPFALGWFSMSPLPRLHHHDIRTIVELFFIYVPCQDKVVLSHFNTDKKKKKGKIPFPGPNPKPNCNTTPWPFGYKALLTTAVHCPIFNAPTLRDVGSSQRCPGFDSRWLPAFFTFLYFRLITSKFIYYATYCNERYLYEE